MYVPLINRYQMYSSLIPNSTFEKFGYCVTADYYKTDISGAVFGITNAQRSEYFDPRRVLI